MPSVSSMILSARIGRKFGALPTISSRTRRPSERCVGVAGVSDMTRSYLSFVTSRRMRGPSAGSSVRCFFHALPSISLYSAGFRRTTTGSPISLVSRTNSSIVNFCWMRRARRWATISPASRWLSKNSVAITCPWACRRAMAMPDEVSSLTPRRSVLIPDVSRMFTFIDSAIPSSSRLSSGSPAGTSHRGGWEPGLTQIVVSARGSSRLRTSVTEFSSATRRIFDQRDTKSRAWLMRLFSTRCGSRRSRTMPRTSSASLPALPYPPRVRSPTSTTTGYACSSFV